MNGITTAWQPTAGLPMLHRRAALLASVREFFAQRDVLEVQTPLLGDCATPDAHVASLAVCDEAGRAGGFLQFSPEFAMKRLLCAGSGPIYQIGKAFRAGESGRWHNPEFTMLEWYRPGFDHHSLMDELDALLAQVADGVPKPPLRLACADLFGECYDAALEGIDDTTLRALAARHDVHDPGALDRTDLLEYLLSLAAGRRFATASGYVFDFPPEQAALASVDGRGCAERFELYLSGQEIANGYHELTDAEETRRRMQRENARRRARGRPERTLDERLLAAMHAGLPACAGVAVGIDRLLAVLVGASSLAEVLQFPRETA